MKKASVHIQNLAIYLYENQDVTVIEIAKRCGVHRDTIYEWAGRGEEIKSEQKRVICSHIYENITERNKIW